MGMKRSCLCGCWSEVQQECLYNGSACIRDDERKRKEVTKEQIEEKAEAKAKEIMKRIKLWEPSLTGEVVEEIRHNILKDFIRSLLEDKK